MEDHQTGKIPAAPAPDFLRRMIIYSLTLSFLLVTITPATALVSTTRTDISIQKGSIPHNLYSGTRTDKNPLVLAADIQPGISPSRQRFTRGITAASPVTVTASPTTTPLPARRNQSALLQTIVKNAAERPKITIPVFWFGVVVITAFIGLVATLFILLRKSQGMVFTRKKCDETPSGHATVIEGPVLRKRVKGEEIQGPGVSFPPSLEKRFLNAEFIGEGGLARVFRATNARNGRIVAVKVPIRFDEVTGTHFTRDIFFWQGLHHPNIIEIYSSNILPVPYVEMEYAPSSLAGVSLPLPENKALGIIRGVARGIAYAHEKGIIHRDIKPENILITADGIPKITDWGLGKAMSDMRQSSIVGLSPLYAAPEQISPSLYGKPGAATDIYQVGLLFYMMLTGNVPFIREDMHEMSKAILHDIPPMPSWNGTYEQKIQHILKKCLEKRPEDRYGSAVSLIEDLDAISGF